jgi:hypothetical protein
MPISISMLSTLSPGQQGTPPWKLPNIFTAVLSAYRLVTSPEDQYSGARHGLL